MEPEQRGVFSEIDAALVRQAPDRETVHALIEMRVLDSDFPRKPNHFG